LNKIVSGPPDPPRWVGARAYPPALAEIVMRALAREPADRIPTAQALQVALETFARAERLEVSTVALAAFVQRLFADDLAAWHAAQRAGKSLADHLAEREARRPTAAAPRTATDAFAATRRVTPGRETRRAVAVAALLALTVTGGLLAESRHRRRTEPPTLNARQESQANKQANKQVNKQANKQANKQVKLEQPVSAPRATDVSTAAPAGNIVEAHLAPSAPVATTNVGSSVVRGSDKGAPRRGGRGRSRLPSTPAAPSAESRLHAWDPDSPVPP
jgi:hypothetical protein